MPVVDIHLDASVCFVAFRTHSLCVTIQSFSPRSVQCDVMVLNPWIAVPVPTNKRWSIDILGVDFLMWHAHMYSIFTPGWGSDLYLVQYVYLLSVLRGWCDEGHANQATRWYMLHASSISNTNHANIVHSGRRGLKCNVISSLCLYLQSGWPNESSREHLEVTSVASKVKYKQQTACLVSTSTTIKPSNRGSHTIFKFESLNDTWNTILIMTITVFITF